ncbi:tautomerase family protein [Litoribacillus peritrichatus]|uniref:Tautomerase family protein n=1 Tax=Litoribacillus peritrichatus TaxID=718191 RepID=A0ABP7M6P7_9GAMM
MPLYTVSTKTNLSPQHKNEIVCAITEIHCQLTGAPADFVQVVFSFGVSLPKQFDAHVTGSIRSGRTQEVKAELTEKICSAIANALNSERHKIESVLLDVPAKWVIEGGEIMPQPGEEDEWYEQLSTH